MSEFASPITEELLLEQSSYIRAWARRLVGEESAAEDLGQEGLSVDTAKSGTLHLPYLQPGSYDICVGELVFRKRIQITGPGMRLKLD